MSRLIHPFLLIGCLTCWAPPLQSACPGSIPNLPDPDGALRSGDRWGWFGTAELAAMIPADGHWYGMGKHNQYADKWWWWRQGYNARQEALPELSITGRRLDSGAPPLVVGQATNGFQQDWDAMLVGPAFPAAGCWEIVGRYRDRELKIVLQVGHPAR